MSLVQRDGFRKRSTHRATGYGLQPHVNARPQAIDFVTRVSRRVEFIEAEFNGTGVSLSYIEHQVSASDAASR
jgi:hypothetical protein